MRCIVPILFMIIILILLVWWFVIINAPSAKYVERYKLETEIKNEVNSDVNLSAGRILISPSDKCITYKVIIRGLENSVTSITFSNGKVDKNLFYSLEKHLLIEGKWSEDDDDLPLDNDLIRDFQNEKFKLIVKTTEYHEGEIVGLVVRNK